MEGLLLQGCGWRLALGPGGPVEFIYIHLYIFTHERQTQEEGTRVLLAVQHPTGQQKPGNEGATKTGKAWSHLLQHRIYRSK